MEDSTTTTEEEVQDQTVDIDAAKAEAAAAAKEEYDKKQQQIDQERANARRAREQAEEAKREAQAMQQELNQTKEQLAEINEKLNRQRLDPDAADIPEVVQYATKLEEQLRQQERELKSLKQQQGIAQQKMLEDQTAKESAALQERILSDCDEEFGAKFRNEALKMADSLVDKGEVELPRTPLDGYQLMRKCYKKLASKTTKKQGTATDSGGSVVPADSGIKPGSRQDVLKQMKKNPNSWKARAG